MSAGHKQPLVAGELPPRPVGLESGRLGQGVAPSRETTPWEGTERPADSGVTPILVVILICNECNSQAGGPVHIILFLIFCFYK